MKKGIKNIVTFILALVVLFSTTGFTISKHYCGNNLVSVTINDNAKSCCDSALGNCCHTENKHYQVQDDFSVSGNIQITHTTVLELFPLVYIFNAQLPEEKDGDIQLACLPPPLLSIQTRLSLLQTYLI